MSRRKAAASEFGAGRLVELAHRKGSDFVGGFEMGVTGPVREPK